MKAVRAGAIKKVGPVDEFAQAFILAAKRQVNEKEMRGFKARLDTSQEGTGQKGHVTDSDTARELDYYRDFSMYKKIKESRASGDLLFGIGYTQWV